MICTDFIDLYEKLSDLNKPTTKIIPFLLPSSSNGYLSNWYPSPIRIFSNNFSSGEQAFMWAKADVFKDDEIKAEIMKTNNPKKLKSLGRKIKNFDDRTWSAIKESLMTKIVTAKFEQNLDLLEKLLSTEDAILVEANAYDKFWGCGLNTSDVVNVDPEKWKGKNILGKILMEIRDTHSNSITEAIELNEGKNVGYISYGIKNSNDDSPIRVLDYILQSDKIKSSVAQEKLYPGSDKDAFVSTSRDYLSHIKNNSQRPVGIILDGNKLSNKYKINPINWATLEFDKDTSRLSIKYMYEFTNLDNPSQKVYKVQFDNYGAFFVEKEIFEILEKIMQYYNATETVNRSNEKTTLGATKGFIGDHGIGKRGKNASMPYDGKWVRTKGYFYNVQRGGGVNISKRTLDTYRDRLKQDGIDLNDHIFISKLVHNRVLDETEERLIQDAIFVYDSKSYTKDGIIRKGARPVQVDTFFDIKDCVELVLLPIKYKDCWDSNGQDSTYEYKSSQGYITRKELTPESLVADITNLKQTVAQKGLQDRIYWITDKSTNADINRAIRNK